MIRITLHSQLHVLGYIVHRLEKLIQVKHLWAILHDLISTLRHHYGRILDDQIRMKQLVPSGSAEAVAIYQNYHLLCNNE